MRRRAVTTPVKPLADVHPAHARPRRQSSSSRRSPSAARRRCSTLSARSSEKKLRASATTASPSMWTAPWQTRPRRSFSSATAHRFDEETARPRGRAGINPLWFERPQASPFPREESKAINFDPDPQGHPLRQRHVRGGPHPPPSEAQPLAEGEHDALRRLSGGGNARPQALSTAKSM